MIARYRLLAERLRVELRSLEEVVLHASEALSRASRQPDNYDFFIAAAAFDLHSFYSGLERLLELIATDVDNTRPGGASWHRELLTQMSLALSEVRPAALSAETVAALAEYLDFRHVVRHMYTFNLRPDRVTELVNGLPATFELVRRDLLVLADFLDGLSTADTESA